MSQESFQPISVKPPTNNPLLFKIRCFVDLQLMTIVHFLQPEISNLPSGSIIDIGAGESPWRDWLPKRCLYQGIDVRNSTEFGMSQRGNEVVLYDGGVMPLESNSFDGALCIEVLEHAEDPDFLLSEIFRIMKPGSVLLLTVPWSARRHHIPHDYHRFTKERLNTLLINNGFTAILIKERGNDYCVIANKLLIACIRNIQGMKFNHFLYQFPLSLTLLVFSLVMLIISYLSLLFEPENNEDPLGYACKARKP